MTVRTDQRGSVIFQLIILVAGVALVGYFGYAAYSTHKARSAQTAASSSGPGIATGVPSAPEIVGQAGLDQAAAVLNQVDPNTSNTYDSSQLSSQLNF